MKKGKNVVLLLGIIFMAVQLLINVVRTNFRTISGFNLALLGCSVLFYFAILIFPILTLRLNLKNKCSRKMAITAVITCSLCLLLDVLTIVANLPQSIILANIGYVSIVMLHIMSAFAGIVGILLLIVGSALSARKKEETVTTDALDL